ncbi:PKD domain-containing protein, partial [Pedobacter sp.]|uniref:PKD domain-containing protein n=1 Tax=Pedobacter sp. TaxID=1411316 RepID=UPI002C249A28
FAEPMQSHRTSSLPPRRTASVFSREYTQYLDLTYNSKWFLVKMTDTKGANVTFQYSAPRIVNDSIGSKTLIGKDYLGNVNVKTLYYVNTQDSRRVISSISGENGTVGFTHSLSDEVLTQVSLPNARTLTFNSSTYNRYLSSIQENGCDASPPYQFSYQGLDLPTGNIRSSTWNQQDYWGYYNASADTSLVPKIYVYPYNSSYPNLERYRITPIPNYPGTSFIIPGADRQVNPNTVMSGTLNKIVYPTGGSTTLEYESNDYYDPNAQSTFYGGGIRVKRITESDGMNPSNNVVKDYVYTNPATSVTSGKPIHLPVFAINEYGYSTSNTQDTWEKSTLRSSNDLSVESDDIIYGFVTVKQTGLGKTTYEFTTPGTNWDTAAGDWVPPVNYVARPTCSLSLGTIVGGVNIYPFAPSPNYDFERGLLKSATSYNESNIPVSKEEYTYQRTGSPQVIQGLRIEGLDNLKVYAKYNVLASVGNLNATKKTTIYDLNDASKFSENLTTNYYTSANHKNVTKVSAVNSEGVTNNTYMKYIKDYTALSSGDVMSKAIYGLQGQNVNAVVEQYNSIIKPSEAEKFMSGKLTKFQASPLSALIYVPSQTLQFINNDGATAFTPSTVSSGTTFQNDSKYIPVISYENYNSLGMVTAVSDKNKGVQAYYFNNSRSPVVSISNARDIEVLYANFEDNPGQFSMVNFTNTADAHTGINGSSGQATSYLQGTLKKGNAKNYIFSCWLEPAAAGSITLTLTNTSSLVRTYTLPYAVSTDWKYYELKVPVTEMTANFTLKAQPNSNLSIDDVLFYPENAEVNSFTYNANLQKLSEINSNGITVYYVYDKAGRLKYVKDQDKNLVRKETYVSYNKNQADLGLATPGFSTAAVLTEGVSAAFTINPGDNDCIEETVYTWNFGDGTAPVVTTGMSTNHVFASAGNYTVSLSISHPAYGTKTFTKTVSVSSTPLVATIVITGVNSVDNCHIEGPWLATYPGFSSDATHAYFNIASISGCSAGATYTYQWERSDDNVNWSPAGTAASLSYTVNTRQQLSSYWIRCTVTSSCGKTAVSNVATFAAYSSSPDCP